MRKNLIKAGALFAVILTLIIVFCSITQLTSIQTGTQVISQKVLVPGGQSVGIKLNVKGVIVVGLEEIESYNKIACPAYNAGIQVGDRIVSINNSKVYYASDVSNIIAEGSGKNVTIEYERNGNIECCQITPMKSITDGSFKLGIWVKEKIAGVGTLTFYDPETSKFACLGHGIYEHETNRIMEVGNGHLFLTRVNSIKVGAVGSPGEIRGMFCDENTPVGTLERNCEFGIFGFSNKKLKDVVVSNPMAVGKKSQIEKGDAYIYTTIDGQNVEKFNITIEAINGMFTEESKGIEFSVTDRELLDTCGGIIQGMSGSPIIQNNRIIGAVTHVLVNDPTKGYGVFIENMIEMMD